MNELLHQLLAAVQLLREVQSELDTRRPRPLSAGLLTAQGRVDELLDAIVIFSTQTPNEPLKDGAP